MIKNCFVSIIIPAIIQNELLDRCLYSIFACFKSFDYEILIIVPNVANFKYESHHVRIIQEKEKSIYGAMNTGIIYAKGKYMFFIGQDDIILPEFENMLKYIKNKDPDLIISNVFWGRDKIYNNVKSRYFLIHKNWCHQGIVYKTNIVLDNNLFYDLKYSIQADHLFNIVFCSKHIKAIKYNHCISWYSANGASTKITDKYFRIDFPQIILTHYGYFSFLVLLILRNTKYFLQNKTGIRHNHE